jgi:dipeptidyl aminopeptidase/acylaminoacyl peptidase
MDAELMDDMDRYRALSPLTDCTEVHCPVLILQGTDDERCPRGQSEQFFSTLVRLQKPDVTLVLFPGGSHHVSSTGRPSHRKAYFDHLVEWLEKHVEHARQEPATASPSRAEHARNDERETVEE